MNYLGVPLRRGPYGTHNTAFLVRVPQDLFDAWRVALPTHTRGSAVRQALALQVAVWDAAADLVIEPGIRVPLAAEHDDAGRLRLVTPGGCEVTPEALALPYLRIEATEAADLERRLGPAWAGKLATPTGPAAL